MFGLRSQPRSGNSEIEVSCHAASKKTERIATLKATETQPKKRCHFDEGTLGEPQQPCLRLAEITTEVVGCFWHRCS